MFGPGGVSPIQLLIVVALAVFFFGGKGRLSSILTDFAKGLRGFRQGLRDDESEPQPPSTPAPLQIALDQERPAKDEPHP